MGIALTLSSTVIEHLGEDFELEGKTVTGIFNRETKNNFSEYLNNPKVFMHVREILRVEKNDLLNYRGDPYKVVRVVKEQEGIKKLELRCAKEQKLETILPRG